MAGVEQSKKWSNVVEADIRVCSIPHLSELLLPAALPWGNGENQEDAVTINSRHVSSMFAPHILKFFHLLINSFFHISQKTTKTNVSNTFFHYETPK